MDYEQQIRRQLVFLYGDQSEQIWLNIIEIIEDYRTRLSHEQKAHFQLTEKDAILITYGDQFQSPNQTHLQSLAVFLDQYLGDTINRVHLLPFFPYSSDDGFSVIDYRQVDPGIGSWEDIRQLSENYQLMFDAVVNHISKESEWFQAYLQGDPRYRDYFIEVEPAADLSSIFRPRALPLLSPVKTKDGTKHVWTTFSDDQVDLNFSNPQVLLEIIDLLLFYVENGASLIRLDAVGYVWKELGTSSLNLPQAHSVVKILRAVLNIAAPDAGIITETNIPHEENVRYFGDPAGDAGSQELPRYGDEAQMVYQFSLAPLILHTYHTGDVSALENWIKTLEIPYQESAFLNFIASHDGIGLMPAKDLLEESQIQVLIDKTLLHGGEVSYKTNSDGTKSVYELNITLYDALNNPHEENSEHGVNRFLSSQAIMLSMAGIPGIYVHSLFGSRNCYSCRQETGRARSINREKFDLDQLLLQIEDQENIQAMILDQYQHLLSIRHQQPAFHPAAAQQIIGKQQHVFKLLRTSQDRQSSILCLINISSQEQQIELELETLALYNLDALTDLITGQTYNGTNNHLMIILDAYQIMWLSNRKSENQPND